MTNSFNYLILVIWLFDFYEDCNTTQQEVKYEQTIKFRILIVNSQCITHHTDNN